MSKAIGLIEVTGYVAAVEAADSAVKAANVTLIGIEKVKAGISTVKITGDVGAVKAAVDAAAASADSLGLLRGCSVIARVDEQVDKFFFTKKEEVKLEQKAVVEETNNGSDDMAVKEETVGITKEKNEEAVISEGEGKASQVEVQENTEDIASETIQESKAEAVNSEIDYNTMKVEELRRLVRTLQIPGMTNKQIKFAKKDVLVKAILDYKKAGEK